MSFKNRKRALGLLLLLGGGAACLGLVLYAFQASLIFFYTPTQFLELPKAQRSVGGRLRLGGMVKAGSLQLKQEGRFFALHDEAREILVQYQGVIPDLFREGQGVVVEGAWEEAAQRFYAKKLFTKHDETYMPRELVQSLKEQGRWQHAPASRPN